MKCPHGNHEAEIPTRAEYNADAYGKSVMVKTDCCDRPVRVIPIRSLRLEAYEGDKTEDDWGDPL